MRSQPAPGPQPAGVPGAVGAPRLSLAKGLEEAKRAKRHEKKHGLSPLLEGPRNYANFHHGENSHGFGGPQAMALGSTPGERISPESEFFPWGEFFLRRIAVCRFPSRFLRVSR